MPFLIAASEFCIRFLFCNFYLILIAGILRLVKRIAEKRISSFGGYLLDLLIVPAALLPFLPVSADFPKKINVGGRLLSLLSEAEAGQLASVNPEALTGQLTGSLSLESVHDFAVGSSSEASLLPGIFLLILWALGILFLSVRLGVSAYALRRMRQHSRPVFYQGSPKEQALENGCASSGSMERISRILAQCQEDLDVRVSVPVYLTRQIKTPCTCGIFVPKIFLPDRIIKTLSDSELRYMLLHELSHIRHLDSLTGLLLGLTDILYWFNPVMRFFFRELKADRELACDACVLRHIGKAEHADYGYALLRIAELKGSASLWSDDSSFVIGIGGTKKQIVKRIRHIAAFRAPKKRTAIGTVCVLTLTSLCLSVFVPALTLSARKDRTVSGTDSFSASGTDALGASGTDAPSASGTESLGASGTNSPSASDPISEVSVESLDLERFFQGYDGSFVLYDTATKVWRIYNEENAYRRVSPDSTYKIYSALLALEKKCILPNASYLSWDKTEYPFEEWNQDQTLHSAMANSVNWYFQYFDRAVGITDWQQFVKDFQYGNQDLSAGIDNFWLESSLKIAPKEQVDLLMKLFTEETAKETGFAPENIQTVKDALLIDRNDSVSVYGKTGTGLIDGKEQNGWFIGWIELTGRSVYFAVNIHGNDNASGMQSVRIADAVLREFALLP